MTKRIMITGAGGFIGYHLAKRLLATEADIRLTLVDDFSRSPTKQPDEAFAALAERPKVHVAIRDVAEIECVGVDEIYHLAAINGTATFYERPADVLRVNLSSLMNVLAAVSRNPQRPRLLFASSNEAYAGLESLGALPIPTAESVPLVVDDTYNARWSYGGSKLAGELLMIAYAKQYGVQGVIVRPHNFYGPRSGYGHVIPQMLERIRTRQDPFVIFGAAQRRTFCYIDDAVDAMIRAMDMASPACPTYHIGDPGAELSMEALARWLFDVASWTPESITHEPAPTGSVRRRVPDCDKIYRDTGWVPATRLGAGLRKTAEWYLAGAESRVTPRE